jgi:hypothetical protein
VIDTVKYGSLFVDGGSHINGVAWTPDLDVTP